MERTFDIQEVTPAQVVRAYKGRPGCACGCRGQYWTNDQSRAMVTKVLRMIQAHVEVAKAELEGSCTWIEATVGGKVYVAYLSDT